MSYTPMPSTSRSQCLPRQTTRQLSLFSTDSTNTSTLRSGNSCRAIPSHQERSRAFPDSRDKCVLPPLSQFQAYSTPHGSYRHEERQYRSSHEPSSAYFASSPSSPIGGEHPRMRMYSDYPTPESRRSSPEPFTRQFFPVDREDLLTNISQQARTSTTALPSISAEFISRTRTARTSGSVDLGGVASTDRSMSSLAWKNISMATSESSYHRTSKSAEFIIDLDAERTASTLVPMRGEWNSEDDGHWAAGRVGTTKPSTMGMLPNRDYYPLPHHQSQFDTLMLQDVAILQQRESVGLNTLECEPGQPPLHSMPIIIECAILGSPHQKLTLSELRITLKRRFQYYEKEEEKGVKSWERTLLQNLSKKSRFINTERPMSEPGQGGYWQVNHDAPPPNRARKRNVKRFDSPLRYRTTTIPSPSDQSGLTGCVGATTASGISRATIGGPSSLFRSIPAELLSGGLVDGMNERCIVLPDVRTAKPEIFPSSPRHWIVP